MHVLDPYIPSEEERTDSAAFARNVRGRMAAALGVAEKRARAKKWVHPATGSTQPHPLYCVICAPSPVQSSTDLYQGITSCPLLFFSQFFCTPLSAFHLLLPPKVYTVEEARAFYRDMDARAAKADEGKKLG